MPAIYAHDRFGRRAAALVSENLQQIIHKYPRQYQIGLQGPDLFFFYRPYRTNRVRRYGSHLHEVSALPFFRHAAALIRKKGTDSPEYAYLLGYICHFILDSECHPYVSERMKTEHVAHLEIEEEFEKLLLRMDGENPFSYPTADLIPMEESVIEAIVPFYPSITTEQVRESLKDYRLIRKLFTAPGSARQKRLNILLKLTGLYGEMKGLLYQIADNPACFTSSAGLLKRFDQAVPLAAAMMEQFDQSIRTGVRLDPRFDRTFE